MRKLSLVLSIIAVTLLGGCSSKNPSTPPPTPTQASEQSKSQGEEPVEEDTVATTDSVIVSDITPLDLRWIGLDTDTLSPTELKPDSKGDGHFHITVPFTQPSVIKSMWLRYNEVGKSLKWGWLYNKNLPSVGYLMAVTDGVGNVIIPQGDNGFKVQVGLADFDLFISELDNVNNRDTFKFDNNQTFTLEVNYITTDNKEKQFNTSITIVDPAVPSDVLSDTPESDEAKTDMESDTSNKV